MTTEREEQTWKELEAELALDQHYFGICWPFHCKTCGGWGGFSFIQKHDEGPGETMYDPCECTDTRTCPRCGKINGLNIDSAGPCVQCGWNYDDGWPQL